MADRRDGKVVYTAGVFDCFHIGHLNLLRNAKALADHLLVAVSTDDLVSSYKDRTPLVPFEERIEIVRAIRCVDEAVAQTDRDKFKAWEQFSFDIWAIGDDWYGDPYYMDLRERFDRVGVQTAFLPYTRAVSSTSRRSEIDEFRRAGG